MFFFVNDYFLLRFFRAQCIEFADIPFCTIWIAVSSSVYTIALDAFPPEMRKLQYMELYLKAPSRQKISYP